MLPGEIIDWKYVEGGKLKGGFTIRALYVRLSESQRRELRKQIDFDLD